MPTVFKRKGSKTAKIVSLQLSFKTEKKALRFVRLIDKVKVIGAKNRETLSEVLMYALKGYVSDIEMDEQDNKLGKELYSKRR